MNEATSKLFPTVLKLAELCGSEWPGYHHAAEKTLAGEGRLRQALFNTPAKGRLLDPDSCLVLFGSFARYEMVEGSDYDWALLIDGVVNSQHSQQVRIIASAMAAAKLIEP